MKLKMKVVYIFLLLVIFFSLASKNVIPSSISENTKTGIEKINSMQTKTVADIKKDATNKKIDVEEKNIENIIDNDKYNRIIDKLDKKEQEIVSLKILGQLSFKEIAKSIDKNCTTVSREIKNHYVTVNTGALL